MAHTQFAPAERKNRTELLKENQKLVKDPELLKIFDLIPDLLMVINQERQLVFCNKDLEHFLSLQDYMEILGQRPGEILQCQNAWLNGGGCGTSENCQYCGAINLILKTQETHTKQTGKCHIMQKLEGDTYQALDLKLTIYPYKPHLKYFYLIFIEDISHFEQLKNLEKIFLHDLANDFTSLMGNFYELEEEPVDPEVRTRIHRKIQINLRVIMDDIDYRRKLTLLEQGKIKPIKAKCSIPDIVESLMIILEQTRKSQKVKIIISPGDITQIHVDQHYFRRALLNIIKNAIEAAKEEDAIEIGWMLTDKGANVKIWISNPQPLDPRTQSRIFYKHFSTKGAYRGFGTFGAKLIVKNVLHGDIWFTTSAHQTTFFIQLPIQ